MPKIKFQKSYSRDTTLYMQVLWAKGLSERVQKKFGWQNPHLPSVAHYVNDGVVEIWEHKKAIKWFLDRILKENKKGEAFLLGLSEEYKDLLTELKKLHRRRLKEPNDWKAYGKLVYEAALDMTIFFYVGMDERNPKKSQDIAVAARKEDDFFADNDVFVRKCLGEKFSISKELAGVIKPDEVGRKPSLKNLQRRLHSGLFIDGDEYRTESLPKFNKEQRRISFILDDKPEENITEFSGNIACQGSARGIVKIVMKQSDNSKVKRGDILVSPMTTPDFLPAMKKAAAFVTDEGGITCHAAIVSREMKKPCIIGTRIATQILKDGDIVEVEADEGIVRILK